MESDKRLWDKRAGLYVQLLPILQEATQIQGVPQGQSGSDSDWLDQSHDTQIHALLVRLLDYHAMMKMFVGPVTEEAWQQFMYNVGDMSARLSNLLELDSATPRQLLGLTVEQRRAQLRNGLNECAIRNAQTVHPVILAMKAEIQSA